MSLSLTTRSLAPSQEMLWEFAKYFFPEDPGALGINGSEAASLHGVLDVTALREAVSDVAVRHDALRMVFTDIGLDPHLRFAERLETPLSIVDLSAAPADVRRRRLDELIRANEDRAFDLLRLPLWEVCLIRLAPDHHVLMVSMCHLIGDGWSGQLLLRDLGAAYGYRVGHRDQPAPVAQFSEVMDATGVTGQHGREAEAYWRDRLRPLAELQVFTPTDRYREVDPGAELHVRFDFPRPVADRIAGVAAANRTTPFLTVLGAYRALLAAWTGQPRAVIGTVTLGREPRVREVIGQFSTNTYIATSVTPDASLAEVLRIVHTETLLAIRHAAPFRQTASVVLDDFAARRPWCPLNFYDVWFQSDTPPRMPEFAGLVVQPPPAGPTVGEPSTAAKPVPVRMDDPDWLAAARKRVTPWILLDTDCRGGTIVYGPAFFDLREVTDWLGNLEHVLSVLVEDPDRTIGDLRLPNPRGARKPPEAART
jgi:hypothetical protein